MSNVRTALVDDTGAVTNVIIVDTTTPWAPPDGIRAVTLEDGSQVGPGWTLTGTTFTPPPAEPAGPALPSTVDLQAQIDDLTDFIATYL